MPFFTSSHTKPRAFGPCFLISVRWSDYALYARLGFVTGAIRGKRGPIMTLPCEGHPRNVKPGIDGSPPECYTVDRECGNRAGSVWRADETGEFGVS